MKETFFVNIVKECNRNTDSDKLDTVIELLAVIEKYENLDDAKDS
ncbi:MULTISPECIES: hypothetical protein [Bacillus cereus group]|uniref:Uncharacterized protein n=1 Tax=Bacillus thuringiensis serovar toumanoffi TaxID=180862 RepID=A0ABD5I9M0_BACTU|nr:MULTISPECIES: hypothetical protein [Bacillus cereus group]EEM93154.1 hypothetical protein bthur0013_55030 [Bacillus thuringiensis IBL 200]MDW9214016.1 hypothetical protein [Bacillus thuringiensis serovar toumanoffi]MEC3297848.1 hypothetical protein [Bacillus thuringiensis]MEC3403026.1 hypothetical protein [Bacillus thuringiensis]MED2262607.1 hypothetical protein [Bacillus thuringiensis]